MLNKPIVANDYYNIQEDIFKHLYKRHEINPEFRFSMRKSFNKNTAKNYFIGTENSNYFGFSLWYVLNGYPGASIDPLVFVINIKEEKLELKLQLLQTNKPFDEQNELVLNLMKNLTSEFSNLESSTYKLVVGSEKKKMYHTELTLIPNEYKTISDLILALDVFIETVSPIVDKELEQLKIHNPDWIGGRIEPKQFSKMLEHLEKKRIELSTPIEVQTQNLRKKVSLNQILFGPPGTGKTYNSINHALSIIENQPIEVIELEERKDLLERYQDYHAKGQIVFTTFHQSLSYEDFIEGLKPAETEGQVTYGVEDGIFKSICEKAKTLKAEESGFNWSNRSFFKMSLGGKNNPQVHSWCLENGVIALGWGGENDLSEFEDIKTWVEHRDKYNKLYPEVSQESSFHCQAARKLLKMKIGDVVVASMGNHIIDAIGIVDGPYEYDEANEFGFLHTRKVKWIVKGINTSPKRFFRKGISQQAIYEFYDEDVIIEAFEQLTEEDNQSTKPHVLIIDEINRGNVSAIFGELITLLEEDKRIGNYEELMVTLPYSKSSFGVPNNVYILGTMNTADRSVEALDVALRRRFTFDYKGPRYDLKELQHIIEDINLTGADLLKIINERISYIKDEDHQIGHSYFMNIQSVEELAETFNKNIIPLLQEYFYNDYGKIRLILGDGFVQKVDNMPKMAVSDEEEFLDSTRYKLQEISSENILDKLKLTLGE